MAHSISRFRLDPLPKARSAIAEPRWCRYLLIGVALSFLLLFLMVPLAAVFFEAFRQGAPAFLAVFQDDDAIAALRLTIIVAMICVPLSTVFGLAAAWTLTKFQFRGKSLLATLIDLPFAVSPVIAGLIFVVIFSGTRGWLGPWLEAHDIRVIFALPGIVLATSFITLPFVARELIPLMQLQGKDEEYAALTLGASGWRVFWKVTIPNAKWALLYGLVLCNARAMGEFGAVAVVSGNIRGLTSTAPLYIETLYFEYATVPAFALSTVLAVIALITLVIKNIIEWKATR